MIEVLEGQESMFDPDGWFGKTCPELSAPTTAKTSKPSSKKSSKSQNPPLPVCLCLKRDDGANQDASTMSWESGVWPGGYTMLSSTAYLNGEKEYRYWLTSEDLQRRGLCLTLNLSEKPRTVIHTKLSQILERNPDPKYNLSAKACQGILNRAEKRGKKLPEALEKALRAQAQGNA